MSELIEEIKAKKSWDAHSELLRESVELNLFLLGVYRQANCVLQDEFGENLPEKKHGEEWFNLGQAVDLADKHMKQSYERKTGKKA